jgi:sterol desaturase/sphingolipid hydroxylase (fatty acid hydroxylase superfamily)
MAFTDRISLFISTAALLGTVLLVARQFERKFPLDSKQSSAAVIVDWKLAALKFGINQLLSPVTTACGIMLINAAGGGWIHLRSDGWWFLLSVILVIVAIDLLGYLIHRAQHKIPLLWAMHSLHHSAEALSAVTGVRHFWLEEAILTAGFPVLGIVFKIPLEVMTSVAVLYILPDSLSHLNIRLSLGPFAMFVNNPQYHRIHHSVEPQHWNKNFCKMLPLFDVIFGTAWKPDKDEFPMTGLASREKPAGILDAIMWPIRHNLPVRLIHGTY